jgi:MoaA/NifB/PqqE/SkfB family radical SAM enzyme
VRRRRAYATVGANFARNLWRARVEGEAELRPLYFIFSMGDACNFDCLYCDNHQGSSHPAVASRDRARLDTDGARRVLDVMRTGLSAVFYVGGEPLMRRDLPKIMRHAASLHFYPQTLTTNATLLRRRLLDPEWRTFLADIDVLIVSLDSLDPVVLAEMYRDPLPPAPTAMTALMALRELAQEYRFRVMVNTVIQPGMLGHARDVLDFANALDITFAGVPQNVGPHVVGGLLDDPEYQALAALILERLAAGHPFTSGQRFNESLYLQQPLLADGLPVSCKSLLKPYIEPDGTWQAPCNSTSAAETVSLNVLDFDSVDQMWAALGERVDLSDYAARCGGSCHWAQHVGANYYYWGLFHPVETWRELLRYTQGGAR